jgi:poly-gamma-glutamate synthesis protein (capsule biosynthesis protein)
VKVPAWLLLPVLLVSGSCGGEPDRIRLDYGNAPERERAFLESALSPAVLEGFGLAGAGPEGADPAGQTAVVLEFFSVYGTADTAAEARGAVFPLSRTWYVPRADPLEGRADVTVGDRPVILREAAGERLGSGEVLAPLRDLGPPYTALRVNGLTAGDPGYPLIKFTGLTIALNGGGGSKRSLWRRERKVSALREYLLKRLEAAPALFEEPPRLFWIAAGGDVMLGRGASEILLREGPGGIFGESAALLAAADLALINLEGPLSVRGRRVQKSYNFRFDPAAAAALRQAGIDAVLQANNHAFDYGEEAFLDSLEHLAAAGIGALGAGLTAEAAARPFMLERPGGRAAVFGIASFPREKSGWDGLSAAAGPSRPGILHAGQGGGELLKARFSGAGDAAAGTEPPALDIVLFHGGNEWAPRPDAATRERYAGLVRDGADLIIGSHPHVVQGFEWIHGKAVFWSLGNYVFGGMENTDGGEEGLFIRLGYWGSRLVYLRPYALSLSHTRTKTAPDEMLITFKERSLALKDAGEGGQVRIAEKGE